MSAFRSYRSFLTVIFSLSLLVNASASGCPNVVIGIHTRKTVIAGHKGKVEVKVGAAHGQPSIDNLAVKLVLPDRVKVIGSSSSTFPKIKGRKKSVQEGSNVYWLHTQVPSGKSRTYWVKYEVDPCLSSGGSLDFNALAYLSTSGYDVSCPREADTVTVGA